MQQFFYKNMLRPLLFKLDSEVAHDLIMPLGKLANFSICEALLRTIFAVPSPRLRVSALGMSFNSPLGLAAGFDKNGVAVRLLGALGFGHVEVGTVTPLPQPGNPKPRIFRLVEDEALINRMGFPSPGLEVLRANLQNLHQRGLETRLGINIGKNKDTSLEEAVRDYQQLFQELRELGDYFVVNVSSPNTPELRKLQELSRLSELFSAIASLNILHKPLLVKIAPDLELPDLDALLEVSLEHKLAGIIATNTTLSRSGLLHPCDLQGGLSGKPLRQKSLEMVRHIRKIVPESFCIIGVGGISCVNDVVEYLRAGANLVQIYTSLIYQGPTICSRLNSELLRYLEAHGYSTVHELHHRRAD